MSSHISPAASAASTLITPLTIEVTIPSGVSFKSLTSLKWMDIPPFAILTGRNGAGKTQFLEMLGYKLTGTRHPNGIDTEHITVTVSDPLIDAGSVAFLPNTWTIDNNGSLSMADIRQRKIDLWNQIQRHTNQHDFRTQTLRSRILKVMNLKNISDINQEQFASRIPDDFTFMLDDTEVSQGLVYVFIGYRLRFVEALEKGLSKADVVKALGPAPWDVLNEILGVADFPYKVVSPIGTSLLDHFGITLVDHSNNVKINPYDLSSGEKMLFRVVTWLYSSENHKRFPRLMLLDEPDAHLHPSMTRLFLQVLREVLVEKYGVRVIISTHSPSTVALAPEDSIFEMAKTNPRIKLCSKQEAIGLLTAGLVTVAPGSRHVFVEDEDDLAFYNAIRDLLTDYGPSKDPMAIAPAPSVAFLPVSTGKGKNKVSGGNSVVKNWVEKLDQLPLSEIFRGVIDRDSGNSPTARIYVLSRYSFENYLTDPFVVYGLLLGTGKAPAIAGVALTSGEEHRIRTLTATQLQAIVDTVSGLIEVKFPVMPDKAPVQVKFTNGTSASYPRWMLDVRGHDLLPVVQATFGTAASISPPKLINSLRRVRLIPVELVEIFKKIQA